MFCVHQCYSEKLKVPSPTFFFSSPPLVVGTQFSVAFALGVVVKPGYKNRFSLRFPVWKQPSREEHKQCGDLVFVVGHFCVELQHSSPLSNCSSEEWNQPKSPRFPSTLMRTICACFTTYPSPKGEIYVAFYCSRPFHSPSAIRWQQLNANGALQVLFIPWLGQGFQAFHF